MTTLPLLLGLCACSTTQDEVRKDRLEAVEKRAEFREDMVERNRKANVDRTERFADRHHDKVTDNAEAYEHRREDHIETRKERRVYLTNARSRLQTISIRLDEAARKAQIKGESTPDDFDEKIEAARDDRDDLKQELEHEVRKCPEDHWDASTHRLDDRLDKLESRVDTLVSRIDEA